MSKETEKLGMEPYKGVRDFYPPDMFVQNYIFDVMRKTVEAYGYVEYGASVLEPAELYRAKSSEEIVSEQTYSFTDRGEREVTLRPEMTPTVARMVGRNRRELALPIRWYSIPNLFRYESPQRGRLREHWQLNVDIFGVKNIEAEVEIIKIASEIMTRFGAKTDQFEIRLNNRRLVQALYDYFEFSSAEARTIGTLIDKKEKTPTVEFKSAVAKIVGQKTDEFLTLLACASIAEFKEKAPKDSAMKRSLAELAEITDILNAVGITNLRFVPTLMRGFDYYTGIVFEVFDTGEKNRRSIFGGGRYDDLLDIFGAEKITAVGFGMGDVTTRDFLETYNLLPSYKPTTDLYICRVDTKLAKEIDTAAKTLRQEGLRVAVDLTEKKVGDQIRSADRQSIPYVVCVGEDEIKTGRYKLKRLNTGEEKELKLEEIAAYIKDSAQSASHLRS